MISRWLLLLRRWSRMLWVRVTLISLGSLFALALAPLLSSVLPENWQVRLGRDAVLPVLTILASSMLAVTTFSLNVMVSAYRTASSLATPRVYRLLLEDTVTQSVLATFVGGFVFSLSALILFHAEIYSDDALVAVFGITLVVVALIVLAILRWIDHLSALGSMDHTLRLIERRSRRVLRERVALPCLGGGCLKDDQVLPTRCGSVRSPASGYVQFIDMARIQELAASQSAVLYISCGPGAFVLRGQELAQSSARDEEFCDRVAACFEVSDVRSFDQDSSFGLTLLAETAQRALSPGINDSGTAIEVIGRLQRLIWEDVPEKFDQPDPGKTRFANVFLKPEPAGILLDRAFAPIVQDGGDDPEVRAALHAAFTALQDHPEPGVADAARAQDAALQARLSDGPETCPADDRAV